MRAGIEIIPVPDEIDDLQREIKRICDEEKVDLCFISGGTGFSVRDVTPEALSPLLDKQVPGISEAIRAYSMTITKKAMLSRAISGIRKNTLVITLPGSPKAVIESIEFILEPLKHGLDILIGSEKYASDPPVSPSHCNKLLNLFIFSIIVFSYSLYTFVDFFIIISCFFLFLLNSLIQFLILIYFTIIL